MIAATLILQQCLKLKTLLMPTWLVVAVPFEKTFCGISLVWLSASSLCLAETDFLISRFQVATLTLDYYIHVWPFLLHHHKSESTPQICPMRPNFHQWALDLDFRQRRRPVDTTKIHFIKILLLAYQDLIFGPIKKKASYLYDNQISNMRFSGSTSCISRWQRSSPWEKHFTANFPCLVVLLEVGNVALIVLHLQSKSGHNAVLQKSTQDFP